MDKYFEQCGWHIVPWVVPYKNSCCFIAKCLKFCEIDFMPTGHNFQNGVKSIYELKTNTCYFSNFFCMLKDGARSIAISGRISTLSWFVDMQT